MKKRSFSLALLAAFNFTPALEAADDSVSVSNMVDSITGILGGTYTVSGTGTPSIVVNPVSSILNTGGGLGLASNTTVGGGGCIKAPTTPTFLGPVRVVA
ncbi:hypothetical protein [Helicobacter mehlei]|uniref:hypothetical protein n=1 Tax=Helicobacter mehlei TaxID=2316080 RepID=UPI0013CE1ADC|nr:hypothetical protein [Helicobacter mehlei]